MDLSNLDLTGLLQLIEPVSYAIIIYVFFRDRTRLNVITDKYIARLESESDVYRERAFKRQDADAADDDVTAKQLETPFVPVKQPPYIAN